MPCELCSRKPVGYGDRLAADGAVQDFHVASGQLRVFNHKFAKGHLLARASRLPPSPLVDSHLQLLLRKSMGGG